ncbi:hypothetical protein KY361_00280 [Candidatus Woesearchaeota archaeon]|nr:hypothetical protein [Candidatus Woesearchaeota archaeon]
MKRLIEKPKLRKTEFMFKGEGHPMLNMKSDFLQTLDLEDIHIRIACGTVEEPKVEMEELTVNMPAEFRKRLVMED